MASPLHESITNDLANIDFLIPDRLADIQRKLQEITKNFSSSGKIYSSEVMALVTDATYLLRDVAVRVELDHLVQTAKRAQDAPEAKEA